MRFTQIPNLIDFGSHRHLKANALNFYVNESQPRKIVLAHTDTNTRDLALKRKRFKIKIKFYIKLMKLNLKILHSCYHVTIIVVLYCFVIIKCLGNIIETRLGPSPDL